MNSLSEVLKSTTSITEVAKTLECSRPTLYRYIKAYDDGKVAQIPIEIKLYFDAILTEGISRAESEVYLKSLIARRDELQKILCDNNEQVKVLTEKSSAVAAALANDPDNESLKKEQDVLAKQLQQMEARLCDYENSCKELEVELDHTAASVEKAVKESREYGPDWVLTEVRHICSGTNGNFIIIFDEPDPDSKVFVELYARIAGHDEYIGRYDPEQGKNFVQITGLPNTLSYSYRIVLFDNDGKHSTEITRLNTR